MDKSETVKPFRITYSVQSKDGIGGLLTISYDTLKELQAGMDECENWLSLGEYKGKESGYQSKPQPTKYAQQTTSTPQVPQGDLGVCQKCGAPNKLSQKGKVYCSNKCWLGKEY